ncbi:sugar kinase [Microbacterium thalli]|uniref:Sugar kinase n=1 Tax=Microbacterium thalli TaxID=3027921 RepID=A0ABT5SEF6_9MICO|nr:sugar kinase [Microbacterium thalli]MDD7961086.1 sugar kinase [Microbacterium thalli]
MSGRIVTFGEALATTEVDDTGVLGPASVAGAELNTAVGLARLGHDVTWASRLGDDAFAGLVRETLRAEGIDDRFVVPAPGEQTGLIVKQRREGDDIRSEHYRATSAASRLRSDDLSAAMLEGAAWLHATCITPALGAGPKGLFENVLHEASMRGIPISLDANHRPQLMTEDELRAVIDDWLDVVDTFFCNEDEARVLTGTTSTDAAIGALARRGPRVVVVKLGGRGAMAGDAGGRRFTPASVVAPPTHPVGAGDAFAAAWISCTLRGYTVDAALPVSAWCAARVVADPRDHGGFPRRAELDAFEAAQREQTEAGR